MRSPDRPAIDALGAKIAANGLPDRGVPACAACHDTKHEFRNYPDLAGQGEIYLAHQLALWRSGRHGGSAFAPVMTSITHYLSDEGIAALAKYYAAAPRSTEVSK